MIDDISRAARFLKRRGRLNIYLDILSAVDELSGSGRDWAKFTWVMYMANMNSTRLKERLQELSYLEMIIWNEQGLRITEKGHLFLKELRNVLKKFGILPAAR